MLTLLVASLAGCLAGGSTLAAQRWGHTIGGLTSALPMIVGPVLLLAALEHGAAFAARAALGTLLGLIGLSGFALAYGRCAAHRGWGASLALAWATAAGLGVLAGRIEMGLFGALVAAATSIATARALLPAGRASFRPAELPRWELPLRMSLTVLLILALSVGATLFGPTIAGIAAGLPVLASVLAVFTHTRDGSDAVLDLLRGVLVGMVTFVLFCALIAALLQQVGVGLAFVLAGSAALLVHAAAAHLNRSTHLHARSAARSRPTT